jgi:hypothetical protein
MSNYAFFRFFCQGNLTGSRNKEKGRISVMQNQKAIAQAVVTAGRFRI